MKVVQISSDPKCEQDSCRIEDSLVALDNIIQNNLKSCGIDTLFPVQKAVLEFLLRDHGSWKEYFNSNEKSNDILVSVPTGSGKTLAYVLPVVQSLSIRKNVQLRALIVVPTADLVKQVRSVFDMVCRDTDLKIVSLHGGGRVSDSNKSDGGSSFQQEQTSLVKTINIGFHGKDLILRSFVPSTDAEVVHKSVCDILITTPGRLCDHLAFTKGFSLQTLEWLIVDEADKLFAQSYNEWFPKVLESAYGVPSSEGPNTFTIRHLFDYKPKDRQSVWIPENAKFDAVADCPSSRGISHFGPPRPLRKMLFSATLTKDPAELKSLKLHEPYFITSLKEEQSSSEFNLPATLTQSYLVCSDLEKKPLYLLHLLINLLNEKTQSICFVNSVDSAEKLFTLLESCLNCLHSKKKPTIDFYSANLSNHQRNQKVEKFKSGTITMLICTDALSRGLDVELSNLVVINYDAPMSSKTYVHRAGRTARGGKEGKVISIVQKNELKSFKPMLKRQGNWTKLEKIQIEERSSQFKDLEECYHKSYSELSATQNPPKRRKTDEQ